MEPATVVIDNGTGYTKMGYAGNLEPSYLIPSVIATSVKTVTPLFRYYCRTNHLLSPRMLLSRTQTLTSSLVTRP